MAFEELSENLLEQLLITKSRIEESRFVNSFNEKFSSLSKRTQTLVIICFCIFIAFLVLLYPISKYKGSLAYENSFENRKELTQKIISYAKRKPLEQPDPKKFGLFDFKNEFSTIGSSIRLLDSQFSVMPSSDKKSRSLPKGAQEVKFKVSTTQLNLNQTITAAYGIKNLSDSILLEGISIKAHKEKSFSTDDEKDDDQISGNYFDVDYMVSNFYVKPESELMPKAAPKKPSKRNKRK